MSFDSYEISNHTGRPTYFYKFAWGNSEWFYTSAERQLTVNAQAYEMAAISHDEITSGGSSPGQLKITLDPSLPVVLLFRGTPPSENVRVTVLRKHADDPEAVTLFSGKIDNVKRLGNGRAEILCSVGGQRRAGLRLSWSRTCPHVLYDGQCRANMATFGVAAVIDSVTGNGFTITAEANADVTWFDGGIIEWDADGLGTLERRAIEKGESTTSFLLFGRSDGLEVAQAVTLYPGCNRTTSACIDKFNNLVNYGGIPQMPGESPYGQNIF